MPSLVLPPPYYERVFDTLTECVDVLRDTFPASTTTDRPRFLFRGESCLYPTTHASGHRMLRDDKLGPEARCVIRDVTCATADMCSRYLAEHADRVHGAGPPAYSEELAMAYVQHYGLPTNCIDFTASLDVAAAFGSDGRDEGFGAIAVVAVNDERSTTMAGPSGAVDRGPNLISLARHPFGERARVQEAYGLFLMIQDEDLKSLAVARRQGVTWFAFRLAPSDRCSYRGSRHLTDWSSDKGPAFLTKFIHSCLFAQRGGPGKVLDEAACWIAYHIPPVPWVPQDPKQETSGVVTQRPYTLSELRLRGWRYDEPEVRENLRRLWSEAFPDEPHADSDAIGLPPDAAPRL